MHFKSKKPLYRRERVATPHSETEPVDGLAYFTEGWDSAANGEFFFTPVLNAALTMAMANIGLGTKTRVQLCLLRESWGNWYPYAVQRPGAAEIPMPPKELLPFLQDLLMGAKPCPLCGKIADPTQHDIFRWHRVCLALAFARDAERMGDENQRKWGTAVSAEMRRS